MEAHKLCPESNYCSLATAHLALFAEMRFFEMSEKTMHFSGHRGFIFIHAMFSNYLRGPCCNFLLFCGLVALFIFSCSVLAMSLSAEHVCVHGRLLAAILSHILNFGAGGQGARGETRLS